MNATLRGPMGLIELDTTVLSIGRSRQNRLVLNYPQVSTSHAEIQPLGDGRYQVIDLESRNGTRVNGARLIAGAPQVLNVGDTLLLGGSGGIELTFEVSAAPVSPGLVRPAAEWSEAELTTRPGAGGSPPAFAPPVPLAAAPAGFGMGGQAIPALLPPPPVLAPPPAPPAVFPPPAPPNPLVPYRPPQEAAWAAQAHNPAPLPPAITSLRRSRRPSKVWLISGVLLVLVLLVVGIGLGAKVIGRPVATQAPPGATSTPKPTVVPAVIQTATVTVQGQPTMVLTDARGLTLYYFKPDTATTTACTGGCIANWPPLLFQGSGTPTASSALPGTLSIITSANGPQVAYNLHQLYRFSGDTAPGQANGEGKAGKWFVVTPTLAVNGNTPALIQTATVTIGGTPTTILTTAQGLTLYYFTPDTATTAACAGACAKTWPPLLFTATETPTASTTLPGTLSVQVTANGPQVEYNGYLLYTYSGDTAPGQTNGEGKAGKWFVVTPTLAVKN